MKHSEPIGVCHFIVMCCHQFNLGQRCLVYSGSSTLCTSHLYRVHLLKHRENPSPKPGLQCVSPRPKHQHSPKHGKQSGLFLVVNAPSPSCTEYTCRGWCTESQPAHPVVVYLLVLPSSLNHSYRVSVPPPLEQWPLPDSAPKQVIQGSI